MSVVQVQSKAIDRGTKVLSNVMNKLLGKNPSPTVLSAKRQVDLFLSMDNVTLQSIKENRGEVEYNRYVQTMLAQAKEIYHG